MSETEPREVAADGTPLVELFGPSARSKLLATLVANRGRELTVSELAREAGVTRKTVYEHVDALVESGAVAPREVRQGTRYTIADSELGELLYRIEGVALKNLLDEADET